MGGMMKSGLFKKYDPLDKWGKYTAEEVAGLSAEEIELYHVAKSPDINIAFLKDEDGNDWYLWLRTLSKDTLKVSYDPETKEIIHYSYDASTIFPVNQVVQEVAREEVPADFTSAGDNALGGAFVFVGGKITPAPVDYEGEHRRKKGELLAEASNVISMLQDAVELGMATEAENASLIEWKRYRVLLNRVDPTNPDWPSRPTQ
jgi:hypothetical protein